MSTSLRFFGGEKSSIFVILLCDTSNINKYCKSFKGDKSVKKKEERTQNNIDNIAKTLLKK